MTFSRHLKSRLDRIDWDFAGYLSDSPFSALHWHPARLPSQVAATCIGLLSDPGDVVLDPFVGSGTSVVEAQRLGRSAIGFDLNPVSVLMSQAKTLTVSAKTLHKTVTGLRQQAGDALSRPLLRPKSTALLPVTVQQKWYSSRVLAELCTLWQTIPSQPSAARTIGLMAFSSILLPVCRETRHWGYVCDNSTPKTDHEGDVLPEYLKGLNRLTVAYEERERDRLSGRSRPAKVQVTQADSRMALLKVPDASVRLLLTSPPYFGVSDYVKSQRLTMEWLGLEIEPIRLQEIGARSKRHRHSALSEYLDDLKSVFAAARHSLQKDATCVIVLGESARRNPYISAFRRSLRALDYELVYETTRVISSQRRQYASVESETITMAIPR